MNLTSLISEINQLGKNLGQVQNIEHANISDFHWFNIIGAAEEKLISDKAFTGIDLDPLVALAKAHSEMVERKIFTMGNKLGLDSCLTERSDGFAAYPNNLGIKSIEKARDNALGEAIERFGWAKWWDDQDTAYKHNIFTLGEFSKKYFEASKLLIEIDSQTPIEKVHVIIPEFSNYKKYQLIILVAEISSGLVTGGACGLHSSREKIIIRAASELFRHALVHIQDKAKPEVMSPYEERLLYFLSSKGLAKFYNRLDFKGIKKLKFPELVIDQQVPIASSHVVYRCLFKDQPPFIGGPVDRMCL